MLYAISHFSLFACASYIDVVAGDYISDLVLCFGCFPDADFYKEVGRFGKASLPFL